VLTDTPKMFSILLSSEKKLVLKVKMEHFLFSASFLPHLKTEGVLHFARLIVL
jgi:hypothetical protein